MEEWYYKLPYGCFWRYFSFVIGNVKPYLAKNIFTFNFRNSLQKNFQLPSLSELLSPLSASKIEFFIYTKKC